MARRLLALAVLAGIALVAAAPAEAARDARIPIFMHEASVSGSGTYVLAWTATVHACGDHARP